MKLLIELPTWMGDTVMVTPALLNLISYFKNPEITLIGSHVSTQLLKNHDYIGKVFIRDNNSFDIIRSTRNLGKFDIFISFRNSFKSKLMYFFVNSKVKYQFNNKIYFGMHAVENYNNFVSDIIGIKFEPGNLFLKTSRVYRKSKQKKLLGINPGASYGSAKRWEPEEFAKVATGLANQYDIVILGGTNEEGLAVDIENHLIANNITNYQNLVGKTSISDLLSIIKSLDLMVTADSGPMHVAAAFKVPTVSIFGPTNDNETSQWLNLNSVILKKNLDCQPCMKRTCPLSHNNCMRQIKACDVLDAIQSLDE
jgi:heptosyltransferase II